MSFFSCCCFVMVSWRRRNLCHKIECHCFLHWSPARTPPRPCKWRSCIRHSGASLQMTMNSKWGLTNEANESLGREETPMPRGPRGKYRPWQIKMLLTWYYCKGFMTLRCGLSSWAILGFFALKYIATNVLTIKFNVIGPLYSSTNFLFLHGDDNWSVDIQSALTKSIVR